jgi:hypothetical protein
MYRSFKKPGKFPMTMTMTIKRSEGIDWCQMFGDFDAETRFRLDKMPTLVSAEADTEFRYRHLKNDPN